MTDDGRWWEGRDVEALGCVNFSGRRTVHRGKVVFVDDGVAYVLAIIDPPGVWGHMQFVVEDLLVPLTVADAMVPVNDSRPVYR